MTTEIVEVSRIEVAELQTVGTQFLAECAAFRTIRDDEHCAIARQVGKRIKMHRDNLETRLRPNIDRWYAGHKAACAELKELDGPAREGEDIIRRGVGEFETRKKAEIERLQREQEAIARKAAREAESKRQLEIERARAAEEERRLVEAQKLVDAGRAKAADAMLAAPIVVAAPPIVEAYVPPPIVYQKPPDATVRANWKFRVIDSHAVPREWLQLDDAKIGAVVRATKGEVRIPGIETYNDAKASF